MCQKYADYEPHHGIQQVEVVHTPSRIWNYGHEALIENRGGLAIEYPRAYLEFVPFLVVGTLILLFYGGQRQLNEPRDEQCTLLGRHFGVGGPLIIQKASEQGVGISGGSNVPSF